MILSFPTSICFIGHFNFYKRLFSSDSDLALRRNSSRRKDLRRNLFFHLILSIVFGALMHFGYGLGLLVFNLTSIESFIASLLNFATLSAFIYFSLIRYSAVIGIQQAYFYFQESQERAFRLREVELKMLKMQLHPHSFFNTVNAIFALMYRSPKRTDRMIIQLGDLFRVALRKNKTQEVPLREELEILEAFLRIHQTLMSKKLQIESQTLDALVPNLIFQPLAENAIQHGLAPTIGCMKTANTCHSRNLGGVL